MTFPFPQVQGGHSAGFVFEAAYVTSAVQESYSSGYTFSSQSIGAADANRIVVVGISARGDLSHTITGVTIGGVTATIVVQNTQNATSACIAYAAVPTGTTATVVVTQSGSNNFGCGIGVYRIVTETVAPTSNNSAGAFLFGGSLTLSLGSVTVPAGGFGLAVAGLQSASVSSTWAASTERYDTNGTNLTHTGADLTSTGTVTVTSSGNAHASAAVATWGE